MKRLFSLLSSVLILLSGNFNFIVHAEDVSDELNGIISYHLAQSGSDSVQSWIDTALTENAGISSEWYILALSQSGSYNFSSYQNALHAYLDSHEIYSASSRLKYALVLASTGEDSPYITESLANSIGQQGIMSWVYALHLMNNGYTCENYSIDDVISQLLSMQLSDGGWAVMGTVGDIDVTAMTIQPLAVYYHSNSEIQNACDRGLQFLSEHQLDYGGYQSFGTENLESTAQVVTALASLGTDAFSDERFIKNGNTLLDGMNVYRLSDGSYSHTHDGISNPTATIQAFYTFVAYQRFQNGQNPLYILDKPEIPEIIPEPEPDFPANEPAVPEPEPDLIPEIPETTVTELSQIPETETSMTSDSVQTSVSLSVSASVSETATVIFSDTENTTVSQTETSISVVSDTSVFSSSTETSLTVITETSVISPESQEIKKSEQISHQKLIILAVLWSISLLISLILWILKKRSFKNFIFIGIICLIGSGIILFIRIQSAEEYYHKSPVQKENAIGTVIITIRCDTLIDKADSEYIPEDGIILDQTEIPLSDGETVYDILMQSAQAYGIQTEHNSSYYISGINYLYEMQYGDLSGWMYRVNGELPSVGCAEYHLKDGDFIEWLYSCEIGNDLK